MGVRIGLTSAVRTLQYHWRTAALLAATLLAAVASLLPLAGLYGASHDWLRFRPTVRPVPGGDWGLPWLMHVAGPSAAQQEAASTLGSLLLALLSAMLAVALVSIITLGAARAGATRDERLIQRAVGASRRMLVSSALTEMALVAAVPLLLGTLAGLVARQALAESWPGTLPPGANTLTLISAALVVAVFVATLLIPSLLTPRRIRERDMHQALPAFPVVLQSALCLIALVTAHLLGRRAAELMAGTRAPSHNGTVVSITTRPAPAAQRSAEFRRLIGNLASAGYKSVSLSSPGALTGVGQVAMVLTECGQCTENGLNMSVRLKPATHKIVSPDTFPMTGLSVLEGRALADHDDWAAPRVAVVSRSLAGREFQDGRAIGRRIYTGDRDSTGSTVVGVVNDQPPLGLGGSLQPRYAVYLSVLQHPPETVDLLIRDPVDHQAVERALADSFGNSSGPYPLTSEAAVLRAAIAPVRWFGRVFALQGWALAAIAAFGIISYMALWTSSLKGEIGVRRSVGARRSQILGWVLGRSLGVAARGCLAGLWFGIAIWSALPDVVPGVRSWSPVQVLPYALLITGLILAGVATAAWRLSRALPAELLQERS